jgi:hypothetical protein
LSQSSVSDIAMGPGSSELSDAGLSELNAILAGAMTSMAASVSAWLGPAQMTVEQTPSLPAV